jgi:putative tricarboxylic transport membrane protein
MLIFTKFKRYKTISLVTAMDGETGKKIAAPKQLFCRPPIYGIYENMRITVRQAMKTLAAFLSLAGLAVNLCAAATGNATGECIVPSKPGGGFDLTCKLVQKGLQDNRAKSAADAALRINYLPGGIGAVAWSSVTTQRRAEPDTLIAFSGGSLLNLALGKFGKASAADVRWVAAIGADYGMIAVRADSPYKTLNDLVDALKRDPAKISIGAGGTIGSQDWLKVALIAKQGKVDPKTLRFVAFEGGGESFTALLAGHVQAVSGDASEASLHATTDKIRVLAVLSDARLPGPLANVPTAREQGFDVTWLLIRGVYMGPQVSDADYRRWVAAFDRMMAAKSFDQWRAAHGLYPFAMTGAALTEYVKNTVENYGKQAREFGLVR